MKEVFIEYRDSKTETQGRVHTSASAVIVLPAEDFDVELKDSEIKKETLLFFWSRWSIC